MEFILDTAGYIAEANGLCNETLIDPACGSGAFLSVAATRLLAHLSKPMSRHPEIVASGRGQPEWESEKQVLDIILSRIHAVDVHPFAAFLTTLNLTFLLLPKYAIVREHNPTYPLGIQVFSVDSLEKPDDKA